MDKTEWIFRPKPDITAYELAQVLAGSGVFRVGLRCTDAVYREGMPEELRQHWAKIEVAADPPDVVRFGQVVRWGRWREIVNALWWGSAPKVG